MLVYDCTLTNWRVNVTYIVDWKGNVILLDPHLVSLQHESNPIGGYYYVDEK